MYCKSRFTNLKRKNEVKNPESKVQSQKSKKQINKAKKKKESRQKSNFLIQTEWPHFHLQNKKNILPPIKKVTAFIEETKFSTGWDSYGGLKKITIFWALLEVGRISNINFFLWQIMHRTQKLFQSRWICHKF